MAKVLRLFLSSPGDVGEERKKVNEIVASLNRVWGDALHVRIDVLEWKTHVLPQIGTKAQECINDQIKDYDIFLGIMWKRFGTPTDKAESGTEEEFRIAFDNWTRFNRPHILFYFSQIPYMPKNREENKQMDQVLAFKEELEKKGMVRTYESLEEFANMVREHLSMLLRKWFSPQDEVKAIADFTSYLTNLKSECMYMDIRGLATGEKKAHQFRIDQLYIPLKTESWGIREEKREKKGSPEVMMPREVPLQDALKEQRLLIKGDPGAGKTTFLRFLAFTLCQRWLGKEDSPSGASVLWPEPPPLPILIRPAVLMEYIKLHKGKGDGLPLEDESPEWLVHFMETTGEENNWGLSGDAIREKLKEGNCLILLDGLDEAPDAVTREKVLYLAARTINAYNACRVVVTTRPIALTDTRLPPGFAEAQIAPLDDQGIDAFLSRWCEALYAEAPEKSGCLFEDLKRALQARPVIHRMARTPVMLTALAVVYWNEHRLPEQRAELYESIITWLLRSREKKPGRLSSDRCRSLLEELAFRMFTHPEGRKREAGLRWAAEAIAGQFNPQDKEKGTLDAESFLKAEMVDSGIIVERQRQVEFWHLSFQEYLAACRIGGFLDRKVVETVFEDERIYKSEWRELMLLLGGVLYNQGPEKINNLIDEIIKSGPQEATEENLRIMAREVGILGGIVRDLSPYNFSPVNPQYPNIVKGVMGIFEKDRYKSITVQVRIEAADAFGQVGDPRLHDDPMVSIPGGRFWMGAQKENKKERNFDKDAIDWETPVHEVDLSPYQISKYSVTVGQYLKFIEDGGYQENRLWEEEEFGKYTMPDKWEEQLQYPSRPVVYVSWYEAAAYASWCGCRLPTEAEWERAARGPGAVYRKYPWGNDEPTEDTANWAKAGVGRVTPVGIFPESCSPEGVIDMAGNVWEWCYDWLSKGYYKDCARRGITKDPRGPEEGEDRVVRGGCFIFVDPYVLRCASRYGRRPGYRLINLGFRVVRL